MRLRVLWLAGALLLSSCKKGDGAVADQMYSVLNYAPVAGTWLEYLPVDQPDGTPLQIEVEEGQWELRTGLEWRDATAFATWSTSLSGGLSIEEVLVLPELFEEGHTEGGVTVTAISAREVYYGVFPKVATIQLTDGPLAGEAAFAEGVGPIFLTTGEGEVWEMAAYEPPIPTTTTP